MALAIFMLIILLIIGGWSASKQCYSWTLLCGIGIFFFFMAIVGGLS